MLTRAAALFLFLLPSAGAEDSRADKPNIIVILADDLGYADLGCQGSKEVKTPHIDSIATNGVRLTECYLSEPQCCPDRAGLITGRFQNRFGFETNDRTATLPLSERTIGDYMKAAGYVTGMIGKWHLGASESARPYNRGFDETFWHPNGGVLFPDKKTGFLRNMYRGPEPVQVAEYSTDAFGREAVEFIDRHQKKPFFLYLAFVPPHWPMEAKPEHMKLYAHVPDQHRRTMLAMMASMDENVGRVLGKVRQTGLEEKALIIFLSDNGGPTGSPRPRPDAAFQYGQNTSKNDPCRGVKGELLEGGIRVPFLVQWKNRIPAGRTLEYPVTSLDILPTALAVSGIKPGTFERKRARLDGVDLLPYLTGESQDAPHEALFWRFRFPPGRPELYRWAIRQGDWKLVKNGREPLSLYHLVNDIHEDRNLAAENPDRVRALKAAYDQWDASNMEPLWPKARQGAKPEREELPARHAKAVLLDSEIRVECTGNDPHVIFPDVPAGTGPFVLELKLRSKTRGPGQVFWSTADDPKFNRAQSVTFLLKHDGKQWHTYTVKLPAAEPALTHLRLDPGTAPGLVRIARMVLKDANGKVVKSWMPREKRNTSKTSTPKRPLVGVSRWDGYNGSPKWTQQQEFGFLKPERWHELAPWFVRRTGDPERPLSFNPTYDRAIIQKVTDQEIRYGADAGIDYWAFCHFASFKGGWQLRDNLEAYLASPLKSRINFCLIALGVHIGKGIKGVPKPSPADVKADWSKYVDEYVSLMCAPTYQRVIGGRPLLYLLGPDVLSVALGDPPAGKGVTANHLREAVALLRERAENAGVGNPYVVGMNSGGIWSAVYIDKAGLDAVSAYRAAFGSTKEGTPYSRLWPNIRKGFLQSDCGMGNNPKRQLVVPLMSGASHLPRHTVLPNRFSPKHYLEPSPGDFKNHVLAGMDWVARHSSNCAANSVLIYAWNEHSEGGRICPTMGPAPDYIPNTRLLDELGQTIKQWKPAAP
ncbi:MAG: sulfatase-like hydrolase/transferase [Planctomycetota bacterium]|nr:sulfatase-like hydrolase/transferase [Planctomycetota bacterium]